MNAVTQKVVGFFIPYIAEAVVKFLTEERVKRFLDGLIDKVEVKVVETENPYDDASIIVLKALREVFDIPEYDN